jgi:AAA ATPase domain
MAARDGVIGRDEELAVVGAMVDGVAGGFQAVVLRGEAGMGKTTLWRAGIELADERAFGILVASPAAAETEMSFAGLSDLLAEVVDDVLPQLPSPQRRALEVALLVVDPVGAGSDQRAVAVALMNTFRALAANGPVLVAVDDVQWLDAASASVLGYAARRLRDERVGLLLTERTAAAAELPLELDRALSSERIASLRVGPLRLGATRGMLRQQLGLVLSRPALMRIHETSGGNPFYSLELARALEREGLDPRPGEPLRLPGALGGLARRRIAALPRDTRDVTYSSSPLPCPILASVWWRRPSERILERHWLPRLSPRLSLSSPTGSGSLIRCSLLRRTSWPARPSVAPSTVASRPSSAGSRSGRATWPSAPEVRMPR